VSNESYKYPRTDLAGVLQDPHRTHTNTHTCRHARSLPSLLPRRVTRKRRGAREKQLNNEQSPSALSDADTPPPDPPPSFSSHPLTITLQTVMPCTSSIMSHSCMCGSQISPSILIASTTLNERVEEGGGRRRGAKKDQSIKAVHTVPYQHDTHFQRGSFPLEVNTSDWLRGLLYAGCCFHFHQIKPLVSLSNGNHWIQSSLLVWEKIWYCPEAKRMCLLSFLM